MEQFISKCHSCLPTSSADLPSPSWLASAMSKTLECNFIKYTISYRLYHDKCGKIQNVSHSGYCILLDIFNIPTFYPYRPPFLATSCLSHFFESSSAYAL